MDTRCHVLWGSAAHYMCFMRTHDINHKCKPYFMDAKPKLRGDPVWNGTLEGNIVLRGRGLTMLVKFS